MKKTVELEITAIAFGGAGIARADGKVFFVPFTAPGDRVRAEIVRDKKKFAEARLLEVLQPSPDRVKPRCLYFGECGGCAYQHLPYERQLELKHSQVADTLRRIGRLEHIPMRPIIPAPEPFAFRNRIRVHVIHGETGFYAHGSRRLVPIARCEIAQPAVNESLHDLRRAAVADGDYTVTGRGRTGFFEQTNDSVASLLRDLVAHSIPSAQSLIVDAYCGAGFFARHIAPGVPSIIGIEENEHAIHEARRNALPHERYIAGDVALHLGDILASCDPRTTTVILDPPATGLSPRVCDLLAATPPACLLYVSCDPATLARDLALLSKTHYLQSVTPFDMFPQTAEIEVLAILDRKGI